MTDANSDPTDVQFTGEAPATHSNRSPSISAGNPPEVPEVPNENHVFYGHAVKIFHKYCLHMFEQFQEDTFALQRRVQITEGLIDGYNELIPSIIENLATQGMANAHTLTLVLNLQDQGDKIFPNIVAQLGAQCKTNAALIDTLVALQALTDEMQEAIAEIDGAVVELQDVDVLSVRGKDDQHLVTDPTLTAVIPGRCDETFGKVHTDHPFVRGP